MIKCPSGGTAKNIYIEKDTDLNSRQWRTFICFFPSCICGKINKKGIFKGNLNFKRESECCYCITSKPASTMRMSRLQIPLSYFLSPTKHTALRDSENFSRSRLITRSSPFLFSTGRLRIKDHTRDVTKKRQTRAERDDRDKYFPSQLHKKFWKRSKSPSLER